MYNIQMLNKIAKVGTDNLDPAKYTLGTEVENPDAILVRSAVMHDMEFGSNLKAIARAGAGAAAQVIMMAVPIAVFVISQSNIIETMGSSGMKD